MIKCVLRTNIIEAFQYHGSFDESAPKWIQHALKIFQLKYQGDELWLVHGKRYTRVTDGDFLYMDENHVLQAMCSKMFKYMYTMYYTKEEAKE